MSADNFFLDRLFREKSRFPEALESLLKSIEQTHTQGPFFNPKQFYYNHPAKKIKIS
jgi:hypothetical protein